jgi:hypothetical protein
VAAIKSKLGRDFRAFERIDEQSHQAATNLSNRAAAKDLTKKMDGANVFE